MEKFASALRAVVVAAPLALSQVPASAADRVVESTKASVSRVQTSDREIESLREGMRRHLLMEKCYVLSHSVKNASSWLAAIGTLNDLNERESDYSAAAEAFEKAKSRLEAERKAAKVSFTHITGANRKFSESELQCLFGKKVRM